MQTSLLLPSVGAARRVRSTTVPATSTTREVLPRPFSGQLIEEVNGRAKPGQVRLAVRADGRDGARRVRILGQWAAGRIGLQQIGRGAAVVALQVRIDEQPFVHQPPDLGGGLVELFLGGHH